jgi:hypothetical protein
MRFRYLFALTIVSFVGSLPLAAQPALDSVSIGAGYTQQVWYNLNTGQTWSAEASDWDLAFSITGFGSSIRTNDGAGVKLWCYPDGDTAAWNSLDTTGMAANWTELHNSAAEWGVTAFSQGKVPGNDFDLGWGQYSIITHHVTGDSLYVLQDVDGNYKKLWIERLASGTYSFRYADLDGGNELSFDINKDDYDKRVFAYFSVADGVARDLEPATDEWDLLFTRYITPLQFGPSAPVPYGVSGILTHPGLRSVELNGVADPSTVSAPDTSTFSTERNVIGYDWKSFDFQTNDYLIEDSLVYFVEDHEGKVWRLIPSDFGGSADGMFYFSREEADAAVASLEASGNRAQALRLYPNPAVGDRVFIAGAPQAAFQYSLHELGGRELRRGQVSLHNGPAALAIDGLPAGLYLLQLRSERGVETHRLQIQR